jgi:hypothetical protein
VRAIKISFGRYWRGIIGKQTGEGGGRKVTPNRYGRGMTARRVAGNRNLRILGLALAGVLVLSAAIPTHADPPRSKSKAAGAVPGIVQRGGSGSVSHPAPGGRGWHPASGQVPEWNGGWVPPHWGPNGYYGGWSPYFGPPVPTYWVWGPSGGAFDYPFSDWRGPHGGWGNP